MRRWGPVAMLSLGLLAGCSLMTGLDGFTSSADSGSSSSSGASGTSTGGPASLLPDSGGIEGGGSSGTPATCEAATLASDPKNCGVCGKDCLGGACRDGKCGPGVLARGFNRPLGVGISRGKLYVGHEGALVEVSLDGKEQRSVVSNIGARYVWGTDTDVFFSANGTVRRWSPTEDGKSSLVVDAPGVLGVAVSPTHIYYARYQSPADGGGVYRLPAAGGTPELLKSWNHAECVAWADGKTYFAGDGENTANRLADDGTVEELLDKGGPTGIFVLGNDAFIARQGGGQIVKVALDTKTPEILVRDLEGPSGIVATSTAIYWVEVDNGNLGVLVR